MRFFLSHRTYFALTALILCFVVGFYVPVLFIIGQVAFWVLLTLIVLDAVLLFANGAGVTAARELEDRLSNGDDNPVTLSLTSHYQLPVHLEILDELPAQLQIRDFRLRLQLPAGASKQVSYTVRPTERGAYAFGHINLLLSTSIGLVIRRQKQGAEQTVKVYPSYLKLRHLELRAASDRLVRDGQKRIRRVGNSVEFDAIRTYVQGDDPRHINWNATAKKRELMSNHYVDERSQSIYCLVDKSRSMKMPFEGMTLLDYSINASLVLSYVALNKGDRAGLLTFEDRPSTFVKAERHQNQTFTLIERLYQEQTSFNEVDFQSLYGYTKSRLSERSLLVLFTNFESVSSLKRQLPYLRLLNRQHVLLVVFFQNTEVHEVLDRESQDLEEIYQEAIASGMLHEKQQIDQTLRKNNILSLQTFPKDLSVNVINKYLEVKKRHVI